MHILVFVYEDMYTKISVGVFSYMSKLLEMHKYPSIGNWLNK